MGLPSNHCILSSQFLLPGNGCLPRDRGGTGVMVVPPSFLLGWGRSPESLLLPISSNDCLISDL